MRIGVFLCCDYHCNGSIHFKFRETRVFHSKMYQSYVSMCLTYFKQLSGCRSSDFMLPRRQPHIPTISPNNFERLEYVEDLNPFFSDYQSKQHVLGNVPSLRSYENDLKIHTAEPSCSPRILLVLMLRATVVHQLTPR